jgi:sugar phosphate isomerase/epimerase
MSTLPIALQLYSVRYDLEADYYGTLKAVKEMGYDGVELSGLGAHDEKEVKKMLADLELPITSSHAPVDELMRDGELERYVELGCKYIVAGLRFSGDDEETAHHIETIATLAEKAHKAGLTLNYHNHDFEFKSYKGKYILDTLYETIPADKLLAQIDTCWVKFAGLEPTEYMAKYAGRMPLLHLKDFIKGNGEDAPYDLIGQAENKNKKTDFKFVPLGCGCQNVPSLLEAGKRCGVKWMIVEQDKSEDRPMLDAAKMSIDYLRSLTW